MTSSPFQRRLHDPAPILADGAMGTLLHGRGIPMEAAFDQLNLTHPEIIKAIHRDYLAAGAELIETNTFGANRYKLTEHGLEDQLTAIIHAGVRLAREAIAEYQADLGGRGSPRPYALTDSVGEGLAPPANLTYERYVAGSIGPLGVGLQPYGRVKLEDARAAFAEQIAALAEAGADALIFETFTDLGELTLAIEAAHEAAPDVPLICQMTFGADDRTLLGYLPGRVARELHNAGADVIGVNCSGGPAQIARVLAAMRDGAPDAIFSAMPNAGYPQSIGGRTMYPATVEYFADYALAFRELGAAVIGGCCGTTPKHIAAMRTALDRPHVEYSHALPIALTRTVDSVQGDAHESVMAQRPSELAHRLATGQFVVSVEINPPRGHHFDRLLEAARLLVEAGANVLNIADSPTAKMRVSAWAVCHTVEARLGVETILHFPTRGRNMLRIQGDLLGAHALGLRNLFVCMGDPTRIGDYPDAMDNYDIVPSGLIKLTKQKLNSGMDQAGNSIGQPTSFTVGCALNMGADDVDKEIETLRKKIENGSDFALVQPVFDAQVAERFLRRYEEVEAKPLALPLLMGVMPLYSLKHALFLHNEVPGISIPESIFKRLSEAEDDAAQVGVTIAQELLHDLRDMARGAYIIPQFGKYELAAQVVEAVGATA